MKINWSYGLTTHVGPVKKTNEDRSFFRILDKNKDYAIALVADGMGGYDIGDKASELAVTRMKEWWDANIKQISSGHMNVREIKVSLIVTFHSINEELNRQKERTGINAGTTLSVILFLPGKYVICHVGDSRIYQLSAKETTGSPESTGQEQCCVTEPLMSKKKTGVDASTFSYEWGETITTEPLDGPMLTQLTEDHSFVEKEIKKGKLTRDEARLHPKRNVLTECLGVEADLDVYIADGPLKEGDVFLLCSDGFHSLFPHTTIRQLLLHKLDENKSYQTITDELVELANQQKQATDNISVMLITKNKKIKKLLTKLFQE
jgi:PPM family protein phosphatase